MIKDKCAAIINDDQCGYTREQGMTSRPMTVDEMLASGLYVTPSAVNLKFLSVVRHDRHRNFKFKTALES